MYIKPELNSINESAEDTSFPSDSCIKGSGKIGNLCRSGTGSVKPPNSCMTGGTDGGEDFGNACGQGS